MRKFIIYGSFLIGWGLVNDAGAALSQWGACSGSDSALQHIATHALTCSDSATYSECCGGYKLTGCFSCMGTEKLTQATVTVPGCGTKSYNYCASDSGGGGDIGGGEDGGCTLDDANACTARTTSWAAYSTGYRSRNKASFKLATCTCEELTQFQCAAGYWGIPGNEASGCERCPDEQNSFNGTEEIEGCFTYTFSNQFGSGYFSDDGTTRIECHYQQ